MLSRDSSIISAIVLDDEVFSNVVSSAINAGILPSTINEKWDQAGWTHAQCLKYLIDLLEHASDTPSDGRLAELASIASAAADVRHDLESIEVWQEAFSGLPLEKPLHVEPLQHQGSCNYLYRIRCDRISYVVRYHDPIGRKFLARHDPRTAVQIYCAAAALCELVLGPDAVCKIVYPAPNTGPFTNGSVTSHGELVRERIMVQQDYTQDHFLLADYASAEPPMPAEAMIGIFARTLARMHARSCGILRGAAISHRDQLTASFKPSLDLLRFRSSSEYSNWLRHHNWITRLLRAGWRYRANGPIWGTLLTRLGWNTDDLERRCVDLWLQSAAAWDEVGSLAHSDYTPRNCFLDRTMRSRLRLFDFDHVVVMDPAYELGLSANSLAWLTARTECPDSPGWPANGLEVFFKQYEGAYLKERPEAHSSLRSILFRGRCFAGLALAATLEEDASAGATMTESSAVLLDASENLLRWLDGEVAEVSAVVRHYLGDGRQDSFGRALLRESIGTVQRGLLDENQDLPRLHDLREEWAGIVREVLDEFVLEDEMLRFRLAINEDRPRRFFTVLPVDEDWKELKLVNTADRDLIARCRRINGFVGELDNNRPRLAILLPVTKGYRRTFQSLACLRYDIESLRAEYQVEFHICVNFTDEDSLEEANRFIQTMARACRIPVTLYSLDARVASIQKRLWRKTTALNVMLGQITRDLTEQGESVDNTKRYYLHFADTDIVILPGQDIIRSNIKLLEANSEIHIVSGTYTCDEDHGFSAVSSIRKRREYVKNGGNLLNLYGGCMTTTLRRLGAVLEQPTDAIRLPDAQYSEDCYLTIKANAHLFSRLTACNRSFYAFANSRVMVRHPEPANIIRFAIRVDRDQRWGDNAAAECLATQEERKLFEELRRRSFNRIERQIIDGKHSYEASDETKHRRHILAQAWNWAIREKIALVNQRFGGMPLESDAVDWVAHKTQHQICKDIVEQRDIFESLLRTIRRGAFGTQLVNLMENAASHCTERFPEMSWLLVQSRRDDVREVLRENPYLFHWYAIAEEAVAHSIQFLNELGKSSSSQWEGELLNAERRRELCNQFPLSSVLDGWKTVAYHLGEDLDLRPSRERESYTEFLQYTRGGSGLRQERFLRYYNVVGRGRFLENSPRRSVYLHVLGERLLNTVHATASRLRATAGKTPVVEIVRTLYPKLASATINYAGPEPRSHTDRFLRCIYLQESIRGKAQPLWTIKLADGHCEALAKCLGHFLGQLHGVTFGIRWYLEECHVQDKRRDLLESQNPRRPVVDLVIEHVNQIRLFQPSVYRTWLEGGTEMVGSVVSLLDDPGKGGGVAATVSRILRQDGLTLPGTWELLCNESRYVHDHFGALGHLGLHPANLFVGHNLLGHDREDITYEDRGQRFHLGPPELEIQRVYVANHSSVGMIDPAIEAGLVLAELIGARVSTDVVGRNAGTNVVPPIGERSFRSIQTTFLESYQKMLGILLGTNQRQANPFLPDQPRQFHCPRELNNWIIRTSRMAAFALLSRYHNRREYDLLEKERNQLVHICVDLLHQGASFPLPFR